MKSIKKFSTEMNQPKSILESIDSKALTELINGMGFKDIHELKKEKALLTKLEALLKEVNPVSEDDAAEIEDTLLKKAAPKSLESKAGKKEPEVAIGTNSEVAEEEESEVAEEELEEESEVAPKPTRKIMTFEDFTQEKTESNEEEELEEEELEEEELEETVTSNYLNNSAVKSFSQFVVESTINEKDITSDEQFKEYAEAVLKKAFGDEYDEDKAQEVVDGLTSKYSGDYGAMIGALTSSLG